VPFLPRGESNHAIFWSLIEKTRASSPRSRGDPPSRPAFFCQPHPPPDDLLRPEAARATRREIEMESAWTGPGDSLPLSIGRRGIQAWRRAIVPVIHKQRREMHERGAHSGMLPPGLPRGSYLRNRSRFARLPRPVPACGRLDMLK
jgi:hypothetical protein